MRPLPAAWLRRLMWAGVLALLAIVFAAYLDPQAVRALGDRVWSCVG
jgi:hypothetical protein